MDDFLLRTRNRHTPGCTRRSRTLTAVCSAASHRRFGVKDACKVTSTCISDFLDTVIHLSDQRPGGYMHYRFFPARWPGPLVMQEPEKMRHWARQAMMESAGNRTIVWRRRGRSVDRGWAQCFGCAAKSAPLEPFALWECTSDAIRKYFLVGTPRQSTCHVHAEFVFQGVR